MCVSDLIEMFYVTPLRVLGLFKRTRGHCYGVGLPLVVMTVLPAGSLKAARRAAGAVTYAVDMVLSGRNRNAFCAVRPPGHHAGPSGLLESSVSAR